MCLYKRFNSYKFLCFGVYFFGDWWYSRKVGEFRGLGKCCHIDWRLKHVRWGGGGNSSVFSEGVALICARVESSPVVTVSGGWCFLPLAGWSVRSRRGYPQLMMALKVSSDSLSIFKGREKIKSYKDEYTGGDFLGTAFHLPMLRCLPWEQQVIDSI